MLAKRYRGVLDRLARACERAKRDPATVRLVAVSKTQPVASIRALYDLGQRDFGESRAQELVEKAAALPRDVRWHFIGPLQSNKVKAVAPLAHRLHSLDRADLAAGFAGKARVMLQVNLAREPQKRGVATEETSDLLAAVRAAGATCDGLSTIPPVSPDPQASREHFRTLAALAQGLALPEISMGMSSDFEVAIEEGATLVRVGTAIFGSR